MTNFFQQSTRKYDWEDIDEREEYMDTLKAKAVIQQKLRLGTQLIDHYIKDHKKEVHRKTIERGLLHPIHLGTHEWYVREKQREWAAEQKPEKERALEVEKFEWRS